MPLSTSYTHWKLSAGKLIHKRSTHMNSFRVISNVKLIASNVHTKKTTSISAHGFRLRPLYI
nr:MAG TPA: hypothetical protein [Caudoviricetes sp.]